ncbi:hypothetical protein QBC37DRAFT_149460 [Rhypophila decipiens]|uniref:Uncharacterized protein n=1 Tax=Rhypophila decipiens TaxID=261697 RepID=A0AAN6YAM4_9PEZI|nr:hypothetical protein QBC37DRAFT_149460 [Rhypophila decipiens]
MKFSATLALGMAPAVLGKSVHKVYPGRRSVELDTRTNHGEKGLELPGVTSSNSVQITGELLEQLKAQFGMSAGAGIQVNILWVNGGGGAATTVLHEAQTVTVTQTVNGGAEATPTGAVEGGENVEANPTVGAGASGTVVATGATHSVTVGGPQGLAFSPPELKAAQGDTVIFTFLSQNHTATQSAFDTPCVPLDGGMDSGYQANPNNTIDPPPQVAMQVMVSTPLWFFCRQGNHCGKGMTFSINPTAEKTHAMFQALAIAQNGTGADSAIVGGAPPPPPAPPAGDAAATASGAVAAPSATAGAGAAAPSGVVAGTGQVGADGQCVCAVTCSFTGSDFPAAAVQGRASFGGVPGAVPIAMAG